MEKIGIYLIKNEINGKIYVGSSINLNRRWSQHKSKLNQNKHHNSHLQASYDKYGESAFFFEKIQYCAKEDLIKNEQYWIDHFNVINKGYNIASIAGQNSYKKGSIPWNKGLTKENDKRIKNYGDKGRITRTGKPGNNTTKPDSETRNKMRLAKLGKISLKKGNKYRNKLILCKQL